MDPPPSSKVLALSPRCPAAQLPGHCSSPPLLSPQWLGLTSSRPHLKITDITNSRAGEGRRPGEGSTRKRLRRESVWYPPSESMLLRAVGGMTDTLHRPSGHLVSKDSLHAVCTWNMDPLVTGGAGLPPAPQSSPQPCRRRSRALGPGRPVPIWHLPSGCARSPWPCTRGSASPADAARCRRSCRTPCTWRSRAGSPPATGEAWRSASHTETCTGGVLTAPTWAKGTLGQKCSKMNSTRGWGGVYRALSAPLLPCRHPQLTGTGQSLGPPDTSVTNQRKPCPHSPQERDLSTGGRWQGCLSPRS